MSRKKKAKHLRKHLAAQFEDWLDERTPEELELVKVRFGVSVPSFKVTLDAASQRGATGSGGSQRG